MDNVIGSPAETLPFDWRELYLEALFETDRSRLCARIVEAQRALVRREHELFANSDGAERQAVTNALNALYALHSCLAFKGSAAA
jgi:hypothetical protein